MKNNKIFEVIREESIGFAESVVILRDTVSGVHYMVVKSGYGTGLTPLLDKDGKPVVEL